MVRKRKVSENQKKTIERMKEVRQIDSNCLRDLIAKKRQWIEAEKTKGLENIRQNQIQIHRLNGMLLFISDLLQPPLKENKDKK